MGNFNFFQINNTFHGTHSINSETSKNTKKYTWGSSYDILIILVIFFEILLTFRFIIVDKISLT